MNKEKNIDDEKIQEEYTETSLPSKLPHNKALVREHDTIEVEHSTNS